MSNHIHICGKCGEVFDRPLGVVSPVNEDGRPLDRVFLCKECMNEWFKVYEDYIGKKILFAEKWSAVWKGFLSGELISKEKIDFT